VTSAKAARIHQLTFQTELELVTSRDLLTTFEVWVKLASKRAHFGKCQLPSLVLDDGEMCGFKLNGEAKDQSGGAGRFSYWRMPLCEV
jgi:hypothetical protein